MKRLAVLPVALAAAFAPAPASAAPAPVVAGGSFVRTAPFIDGSIYAFECHAFAPGAVSTSITSCVLNSSGGPVAAPSTTTAGPATATSGTVSSSTSRTYQMCWTATATYADGSTASTSGCSSSSTLAGSGVSS